MKAELWSNVMSDRPHVPDWLIPPPGGFTAADLDNLPELPAHTELIDGSLVFVSPQASFHSLTVDLLRDNLRRFAPKRFRVRREMSIVLDHRQRPEPDVIVIRAEAETGREQTSYAAEAVLLAIEVVSPDSEARDRMRKPQLYAAAGIPHFWRVENTEGRPTVYVYELDPATKVYVPTGVYHDRIKLSVPFDIDVDLAEIDDM